MHYMSHYFSNVPHYRVVCFFSLVCSLAVRNSLLLVFTLIFYAHSFILFHFVFSLSWDRKNIEKKLKWNESRKITLSIELVLLLLDFGSFVLSVLFLSFVIARNVKPQNPQLKSICEIKVLCVFVIQFIRLSVDRLSVSLLRLIITIIIIVLSLSSSSPFFLNSILYT